MTQATSQPPKSQIQNPKLDDLLTQLMDKSLLLVMPSALDEDEPRFMMLETIREYALDKLAEMGETEATQQQHAAYYLQLAEQAEPELMASDQAVWLNRLEQEHDNIRAALTWTLGHGAAVMALRIAGAMRRFWYARGYLSEGRRWLMAALIQREGADTATQAKALNAAGVLANVQGDYPTAHKLYMEGLTLSRELRDNKMISALLNNLGNMAQYQGEYHAAYPYYEEALALDREIGNNGGIAMTLGNMALIKDYVGDYTAARPLIEESLAIYRELGDIRGIGDTLENLGVISYHQNDYVAARAYQEQSLALKQELGNKQGITQSLEMLAILIIAQGDVERAVRLLGAAAALREAINAPLSTAERAWREQSIASARAQIGQAAFDAAWAEGQAMNMEQAMAYVLEGADENISF